MNPSIPFWGGPTGIDTDGTAAGDSVYTYGNSSLRAGVTALSPHSGVSLGDDGRRRWTHPLYTVDPGRARRLGLGVPDAERQGDRHPVDRSACPAAGVEQHR